MENTVGKRIEQIRKNERLDIKEFMEIIETSKTAYYGWLNGDYFPGSDIIIRILIKFPSYSSDWLILGIGNMKKSVHEVELLNEPIHKYEKQGISKNDLKNLFKKMIEEVDNM